MTVAPERNAGKPLRSAAWSEAVSLFDALTPVRPERMAADIAIGCVLAEPLRGRDGVVLAEAGEHASPSAVAAALLEGVGEVSVRRPVVDLVFTRDRLHVPFHVAVSVLRGTNERLGARLGAVTVSGPSAAALHETLASSHADAVLVFGGVGDGERAVLPHLLETHGQLVFDRVRVRPETLCCFGFLPMPVLGCMDTPGAALVSAHLFRAPMLARLAGRRILTIVAPVSGVLDEAIVFDGDATEVVALVRKGDQLLPVGRGAFPLSVLARTDAVLVVPEGTRRLEAGTRVEAWPVNAQPALRTARD